jgi:RNA polymerase sigma-70 factor (ECF subfamily)
LTRNLDENPVEERRVADMKLSMGMVSCEEQRRFESLYDAHRLSVLAYCTRRVNTADASDACSETFLVAWRRIDDVPLPPNTLPYLYGIAARVIANQRRTLHRRTRLHEKLGALGVVPPAEPSVVLLQQSSDRQVVAAVRRLKPVDREIVMLYAWEDLPRDVIADMMQMSRAAVDQRIHRAYERLARVLEPALKPRASNPPPIAGEGGT